MLAKLAKKMVNFFWTFFSRDEEKRFLLALFTGDKPFVTSFEVVLVDTDLIFFIDRIRALDGILDGIRFLLSNTFCKLGTAWISMMHIPQNIFFWHQFKLKNVSVIWFCMFVFSWQDCPLGYKCRIIAVAETVIIYNTVIHI